MSRRRVIYEPDGYADARVSGGGEAAILVEHGAGLACEILAIGGLEAVESHEGAKGAQRVRLAGQVVIPGLINAHTHLDLSHVGYLPFDRAGGFPAWAKQVLGVRRSDAAGIRASTERGIEMSLAGGVVAVGDICGVMSEEPLKALRDSLLDGVGYIEFFGIGEHEQRGREYAAGFGGADEAGGIARGISPHAPYSVARSAFEAIAGWEDQRVPIATHVAESLQEREFIARGTGDFLEVLGMIGAYDPDHPERTEFGWGKTPISHVLDALEGSTAPTMLVHVNDCPDADLERVAEWCGEGDRRGVAFCARAHEYFEYEATLGPHRYREMLDAGIPVALGTDSVINLDLRTVGERITPLDDARLLYGRDGVDGRTLMRMMTGTPAGLLGLDARRFDLSLGATAGLVAVDVAGTDAQMGPLERVFSARGGVRLLRGG